MTVVVDASAAAEIALSRESSEAFGKAVNDADVVLAPDIFPAEVTNVFWKYGRQANLPAETCQRGITYCLDLIDDYVTTRHLCREVLSQSIRLGHPAYDIFYLVAARRNDAVVLTRDRRMIEAAEALGVAVIGATEK